MAASVLNVKLVLRLENVPIAQGKNVAAGRQLLLLPSFQCKGSFTLPIVGLIDICRLSHLISLGIKRPAGYAVACPAMYWAMKR